MIFNHIPLSSLLSKPFSLQLAQAFENKATNVAKRLGLSTVNDKKRILLIASNPSNTIGLQLPKEFREIEEGIELAKNHDLFSIKQIGTTRYRDLRRQLSKYQPHGELDE